MRLNRFIAQSGICSRREADDFITAGVVSVNGKIVTELGTKVLPTDEVRFNDEPVQGEKKVYLVLNKPKGYVTSLDDPHAGKTVMELVSGACDVYKRQGMVPIALQMGCETVMDAFNTPDIERFVNDMVAEEVIPMIDEDRDELKKFAAGILERFYNPFIKHMLRSISLNSLSKWEARNYPTVRDNWFKAQRLAEREAFTLSLIHI